MSVEQINETAVYGSDERQDTIPLQAMLDKALDAILAIDHHGVVLLINAAAQRMFGYRSEEIVGRDIKVIIPEFHPTGRQQQGDLSPNRLGINREVEGRCKDGSGLPIHLWIADVGKADKPLFSVTVRDLTERKELDENLRESEERFRQVAAMTGDWIWEQDPSGHYAYCSSAIKEILGYEPDEILGKLYTEAFTPAQRTFTANEFPNISQIKDRFFRLINHYRHKDGHEVITESTGEPILDAKGELVRWRGVDRDITAHIQFANALRESEEKLRLTLDNAPIGIATTDLEGRFLSVNPALCSIFGYPANELLQRSLTDIAHPDDGEEVATNFRSLVTGELPKCEFEKRYVRKDSSVITISAHAQLVHDSEDRPLLVVGEFEDITERKRAAQEMQHMRAYLKDIVDSMPSILVGVDSERRITLWNKAAERATSVPVSEAVGQGFSKLFPEFRSQVEDVSEAIHDRVPVRARGLATQHDGETRYADVMVYPLMENEAEGAVIRVDDVTERVRIEQMMVQTEKMVSVGGLAAGMAHEINNPLSGVLQSCQNILRRASPELAGNRRVADSLDLDLKQVTDYLNQRGILRFVQDIQEAATRASRIVVDMLAFSRRSTTEFALANVHDMLDTVLRLAGTQYDLKKKYDFKRIEIVRDYDPALPEVPCDRTEIEQVFLNLINNAAQAMAEEGDRRQQRITFRTRRDGDYVRVEMEDNGPGMDEETRRRVFEPFFTTKPAGVGTGLGLSVSYFIVTKHHKGTISVRSAPEEGACFVVRLPLQARPAS